MSTIPKQIDILALEPYYGGFRREMLETLAHHSRHRWKILKLPPRRLERRLTTAARWFAEQMSRHTVGHFDVLFTTETLNLADLYRLNPAIARKPSVVYFHSHQLGDSMTPDQPHDYANLSSAAAATELWFISKYGRREFFSTAQEMVGRDAELAAQNILLGLTPKSHVVAPPVETNIGRDDRIEVDTEHGRSHSIILNLHGVDLGLLNEAFENLRSRGILFRPMVIGPTAGLPTWLTIESAVASDPMAVAQAVVKCKLYVSVSPGCGFDENAVRSFVAGRPVLVPKSGGYVELIAAHDREQSTYAVTAQSLSDALAGRLAADDTPTGYAVTNDSHHRFDPIVATKRIDDRLSGLATHAS